MYCSKLWNLLSALSVEILIHLLFRHFSRSADIRNNGFLLSWFLSSPCVTYCFEMTVSAFKIRPFNPSLCSVIFFFQIGAGFFDLDDKWSGSYVQLSSALLCIVNTERIFLSAPALFAINKYTVDGFPSINVSFVFIISQVVA